MKDRLDQYIIFRELPDELKGTEVETNTKYRLRSSDSKYYYFRKHKVDRDYTSMDVDYIKRERGRD